MSRTPMRWWGWGDPGHPRALSEHAWGVVREELCLSGRVSGASRVELADVRLAPSSLGGEARGALEEAVGGEGVLDDREARVRHAAGRSLPDLLRLRAGDGDPAPDAVVLPASEGAARAAVEACARHGVAVVPFGGGTSVVGGVEPLRGAHGSSIALDLGRLCDVFVDGRSLLAFAGAGLRLPELEERLRPHGVTLGHFPQSYEYATVGGCVATRSAGQASTGYGRIDARVRGARLAAPIGELDLPALPPNAAGPDLRELVCGSEGVLGAITSVALAVHPLPRVRRFEGLMFGSFAQGVEAFRRCAQAGAAPDVSRLSDEDETRLTMAMAGGGATALVAGLYLRARSVAGGCLAIVGWEGERDDVRRRRRRSLELLRAGGAVPLGGSPGRSWLRSRFEGPYLRDDLLDAGVLADTLETAHRWSRLEDLHGAVRRALRVHAPAVGCHVSHVYETGASLYFTWLAPARAGDEIAQWRAAKEAASEAIVAAGGTISHHHAVGVDHAPWLAAETGSVGLEALRAVKERLDPEGVMNPGKLLPS